MVISLDLHGILTDRMLKDSDATTVYHTYPQVDFFDTGAYAARVLVRLLEKEVRPVTARVAIPALVRGDELITETGLFGKCTRRARAIENSPGGLSACMFIENHFTDVPDLCSNVFVVRDGDAQRSGRKAVDLARKFWNIREHLPADVISLDESVRLAIEAKGRVILVGAADATSSTASGDSNAILRALLEGGYRRNLLAPTVDAPGASSANLKRLGHQHCVHPIYPLDQDVELNLTRRYLSVIGRNGTRLQDPLCLVGGGVLERSFCTQLRRSSTCLLNLSGASQGAGFFRRAAWLGR